MKLKQNYANVIALYAKVMQRTSYDKLTGWTVHLI